MSRWLIFNWLKINPRPFPNRQKQPPQLGFIGDAGGHDGLRVAQGVPHQGIESRLVDVPVPPGLRSAATQELKRRGIDYLLVIDGEFCADDLRRNTGLWGISQVGEYRGARLYRLP